MRNLVELYPEIKVAYTKVVTISTDNLLETNEMRDALGAAWPFLADPGRTVQKDLDIQEYTDPVHDPMIPHTFVWGLACGSRITTATGIGAALRTRTAPTCVTSPVPSTRWDLGLCPVRSGAGPARRRFRPYGRSMREVLPPAN
jgi:hypothetical protein